MTLRLAVLGVELVVLTIECDDDDEESPGVGRKLRRIAAWWATR